MMDKKRLEELKEWIHIATTAPNNYAAIRINTAKSFLELIDAALSHEATTDAEVQAAIDMMNNALIYPTTVADLAGRYYVEAVPSEIKQTIIRALQQYRTEPCELGRLRSELIALSNEQKDDDHPGTWIGGWSSAMSRVGEILDDWHRRPDLTDSESTQSGAIRQVRGEGE